MYFQRAVTFYFTTHSPFFFCKHRDVVCQWANHRNRGISLFGNIKCLLRYIFQNTSSIRNNVISNVSEKIIELWRNKLSHNFTGLTEPIPTVAPMSAPPRAPPGTILHACNSSHFDSQIQVIATAQPNYFIYKIITWYNCNMALGLLGNILCRF